MNSTNSPNFKSGFVALIGRPNAGKSTLLNRLVGEKIAAVSNKPQTTRHKIQGIVTSEEGQIVFVDTPGVHKPGYLLNRRMMAAVHDAILSVDLVVLMRDASVSTGNGDKFVLELVKDSGKKAVLVLNKIDKIKDKTTLLPLIEFYSNEYDFAEIIPVSALKGEAIEILLNEIVKHLPDGEPIFSEDEMTDQPVRIIVSEMVREKILETTGEELPYVTAVVTEMFDETNPNFPKFTARFTSKELRRKKSSSAKAARKSKKSANAPAATSKNCSADKFFSNSSSRSSKTGATAKKTSTKWVSENRKSPSLFNFNNQNNFPRHINCTP